MELLPFDGQWDLSDLFEGPEDPSIDTSRAAARDLAATFSAAYKGQVETLDAPGLAAAFVAYESVISAVDAATHYPRLRFSVATEDADVRAAHAAAESLNAELNGVLAFFTVELTAMDGDRLAELSASAELADYAHYIQYQLALSPTP